MTNSEKDKLIPETELSKEEWNNWLKKRLDERKQVFSIDAGELIGGYNREKAHAKDYHGREILELVQNADDSGIKFPRPNKVLVKLTEKALFVANTGTPFSPDGINSLMVSDNSPKQLLKTKTIGYKGLGFRSILGWSSSIIISSGALTIGFDPDLAANWLEDLRKKSKGKSNPKMEKRRILCTQRPWSGIYFRP
jgi:hypothetical protein